MIISITGLHGCGKTTQIRRLEKYFSGLGKRVYVSKALESDSKYRGLLKNETGEDNMRITFVFLALYVRQKEKVIKALKEDNVVLLDRWGDVFNAYHSKYGLLSKDADLRERLKGIAFGGVRPDLTFYLSISPDEAIKRCSKKGKDHFNVNRLNCNFQKNLFEYFENQKTNPDWVTIDGTKSRREISEEITRSLSGLAK